ncbi:cysteine desulfurase, partial [Klebsiella oxytoca]
MTFKDAPYRFETGTPIIASAIGLGKAVEYISSIGLEEIAKYEYFLKQTAIEGLKKIPNIEIYNASAETGI